MQIKPFDLPFRLGWAVWITLACSAAHLTHNVMFFHLYPEPSWLNARLLDVWSVFACVALVAGYFAWQRKSRCIGMACMLVFWLSSLSVVMHYKYEGAANMSLLMHALVWLEFIPTLWLGYELARAWRATSQSSWHASRSI